MPVLASYPPRRPVRSAVRRVDAVPAEATSMPTRDPCTTEARRKAQDHGLMMCAICEEPIRGLTCYRAGQACHFGCQGAARGETQELDRLKPCHLRALENVREATRHLHEAALPRLRDRMETLGFRPEDADKTLEWIRDQAAIIIHVDLARFGEKLAADTHYRNQFETGSSGGCLSTDTRTSWEADLFGDAYDGATPFDRCKYGVLNVTNDPRGVRAAHSYGSSYLLLRNVRLRTTFSARDSGGIQIEELATVDYYAHVLEQYQDAELRAAVEVGTQSVPGRDSNAISQYKEAQIHGEVCLAEHVELIMADPSLRAERHCGMLERLANICHAPVVWMESGADAEDVSPASAESDDDAPVPAALARSEPAAAALSHEEEETARAIEASRRTAAEARALEEEMESAEAREFDQAVELSAASFSEELELHRLFEEMDATCADVAMAMSADGSGSTEAGFSTTDPGLASSTASPCPEPVHLDLAARRLEAQQELEDEVAAFAAECGDAAAEPTLGHSSGAMSSSEPVVSGVDAEGEEDAELAAAIKASMEADEEAKRLESLEIAQLARVLEMSSGECDMPGEEVEDDELAAAICASLATAVEVDAAPERVARVKISDAVPLDSLATDASADLHSPASLAAAPATTAISSEPEVEHVVKASMGEDTRRLRSSWCASASPEQVLARIQDAVRSGFGLRLESECIMKYQDEDGDACSLVEPTVQDFLHSKARGTLRLSVEVVAP
mmetsp:Transcript_9299/g.16945  ORF Transcript_9299/g.16945 Transcript_9299/m.16945 type:complete len:737 (+) Transcript_9299:35-2245(+)